MAKFTMTGFDDYQSKLVKVPDKVNGICKQTVYAGAGVLADAIRENLNALPKKYSTGDLADSLFVGQIETNGGLTETVISFAGYDKKGNPNPVKARALESGTSKQRKTPFIRPAIKRVKEKAQSEMARTFADAIDKAMK